MLPLIIDTPFLRLHVWQRRLEAITAIMYPATGQVFDWAFDYQTLSWVEWMATVPEYKCRADQNFADIMVPTADSVCYTFLMKRLLLCGHHVLAVGETGTGKTVTIQVIFAGLHACLHACLILYYCHMQLKISETGSYLLNSLFCAAAGHAERGLAIRVREYSTDFLSPDKRQSDSGYHRRSNGQTSKRRVWSSCWEAVRYLRG
jgi:P-loop containing dynein motor region